MTDAEPHRALVRISAGVAVIREHDSGMGVYPADLLQERRKLADREPQMRQGLDIFLMHAPNDFQKARIGRQVCAHQPVGEKTTDERQILGAPATMMADPGADIRQRAPAGQNDRKSRIGDGK